MDGVKILSIVLVIIFALTIWTMYSVEMLRKEFYADPYLMRAPLLSGKVSVHPSLIKWLKKANVIFVDDMEDSLKWTIYGNGTVRTNDEITFGGDKALNLIPSEGRWGFVEALRLFSPPKRKVMGFAFWWTCYTTNFGYLDFGIEFRNALNDYRKAGEIHIYPFSLPYYRNQEGDLVLFSSESGLPSTYDTTDVGGDVTWHFTAIIIDFEKSEYVSFIVDDAEISMNGIKLYDRVPSEGLSEYNMMEVFFIVSNGDNETSTQCFFDDIIVFNLPESSS